MDKRFFLALLLTALVVIVTPMLFRPAPSSRDTTVPAGISSDTPASSGVRPVDADSPAITTAPPAPVAEPVQAVPTTAADTAVITTPTTVYRFTNLGAAPVSAQLRTYESLRLSDAGAPLELVRDDGRLLRYRILTARDTIALDTIPFTATESTSGDGASTLRYEGRAGSLEIGLTYTFAPDSYLVRVQGDIRGFTPPAFLLIDLPRGLRTQEADTVDDQRHLAYVYKPRVGDATSVNFGELDPGQGYLGEGPITWAATKTKYFLVGLLAPDEQHSFDELLVTGGPRVGRIPTEAYGTVVETLTDGTFSFELYAGPQEWRRLNALGRDFANVNPYGWGFLRGIIQPFATIVMRILLWMRDTLQINYGWILIIFGVAVRILLWPLNQRAMRSSLQLQRLQPQLAEVQKKYANKPETPEKAVKYREDVMRVYQEHGMSPLSPLMGCLPMLLPMPIFFALFFVFQNTIEFRGVEFLWLPDISLKDPLYILPVLMGLSMFFLSWIGMRNAPPNPQTKLMTYVLPVVFTAFLFNFASGLNLYYFVQNIAAIPQQWLIARERAKSAPAPVTRPA